MAEALILALLVGGFLWFVWSIWREDPSHGR
jgi:hypothetical protein